MTLLRARPKLAAGLVVLGLFVAGAAYQGLFGSRSEPGLRVDAERLVDDGKVVRLRGVDWPVPDDCSGTGKPPAAPTAAVLAAVAQGAFNAVRVPLDADCWLGLGASYRSAVARFVDRVHAAGMYPVLALDRPRVRMPAADRGEQFWGEVAKTFRHDRRIAFELYAAPSGVDWFCWRDGCKDRAGGPRLDGMQGLVDAVREAGATQPLLLPGLDAGNDLRLWVDRSPQDPEGQLVASFRVSARSRCWTERCWAADVPPVAEHVPVVAELGSSACAIAATFGRWTRLHDVSSFVPRACAP